MDTRPLGPIGNARRLRNPAAPASIHQASNEHQIIGQQDGQHDAQTQQPQDEHPTDDSRGQDQPHQNHIVLNPGEHLVPRPHNHLDRGNPLPPGQRFNDHPHILPTAHSPASATIEEPAPPHIHLNSADAYSAQSLLISRLPTELVEQTLDYAEYFPCETIGLREEEDYVGSNSSQVYLSAKIPDFKAMETDTLGSGGRGGGRPGRVRRLAFKLRSRDQGWGGEHEAQGTYKGAYSWIDAEVWRKADILPPTSDETSTTSTADATEESQSKEKETTAPEPALSDTSEHASAIQTGGHLINPLLRTHIHNPLQPTHRPHIRFPPAPAPDPTVTPDANGFLLIGKPHLLQRNLVAAKDYTDHIIIWDWSTPPLPDTDKNKWEPGVDSTWVRDGHTNNDKFVKELRGGDEIKVVMRCKYPGWSCRVARCEVEVYWAV